jgi:hypothetical protein
MYVFCILPVEVGYGVVSYFSDERIRVGSAAEKKLSVIRKIKSRMGSRFRAVCGCVIGVRLG